ncbi:MAG: DUF4124 domain-containing protein [Gammaproteobacteria bacterium]|nr:MAG: DUF4124 domain-containing protein [Gammaproteobacteria bacterium]
MIRTLVFSLLLATTLISQAEIYRWVDAAGKVHFSDKKPEDNHQAKDISGQLKPLNSDTSSAETHKLQEVFQGETPEEKAYRQQQQAKQQQLENNREHACQKARNQLSILRGRVAFIDPNGKEVVVTEEQRQERADKLEKEIRRHCS